MDKAIVSAFITEKNFLTVFVNLIPLVTTLQDQLKIMKYL